MSAAARRLGMSPSAVSQTIRALEQHGGVTLLHRSTRKLALTEAGERYFPHCQRMLEAARAAAQSLQQARDAPTGELRLSAPVGFASHLAPALAPLLAEAPQLRLRLLVDDAMIDLIDARIDVAIRIGRLADSSWIARRLCDFETILCASPEYLARAGVPATPQQLPAHQWLALGRETPLPAPRRTACERPPTRHPRGRPGPGQGRPGHVATGDPSAGRASAAAASRSASRCGRASPATTRPRCSRCASTAWASRTSRTRTSCRRSRAARSCACCRNGVSRDARVGRHAAARRGRGGQGARRGRLPEALLRDHRRAGGLSRAAAGRTAAAPSPPPARRTARSTTPRTPTA